MGNKAPIVLFTYNRPDHTQKVLDALAANAGARESQLYIYCDGPKGTETEIELKKISEVRSLALKENRFKDVKVIRPETNKGLAASIIDGVTDVVNAHGRVIVLEDDVVTSPGFLKFMNDALDVYEDEEQVMHVSGYMYPVAERLPETFFYKPTTCWGWGTWQRSWKKFEKNAEKQMRELTEKKLWKEFTVNETALTFKRQLEANLEGRMNTWAIFWYASVFLAGGTCLHPYPSLVQNIGLDGSGIHYNSASATPSPFTWKRLANRIQVEKKTRFSDPHVDHIIESFWIEISRVPSQGSVAQRTFRSRIKEIIKQFTPPIIIRAFRRIRA